MLFQVGIGFGGFQTILNNMQSMGFFQFLFPFLLSLAIFYSLINYAAGDRIPKNASGLISLILSFFVMLFASANPSIVNFFEGMGGGTLIAASAILFFLILLGMVGFKVDDIFKKDSKYAKWVLLLAVIIVLALVFLGAGGSFFFPGVYLGTDFWTIIFFIVILVIVIYFLKDDGGKSSSSGDKK